MGTQPFPNGNRVFPNGNRGVAMTKVVRISDTTYRFLIKVQRALLEQKGEDHKMIAITEKIITNAKVDRLYGITLDDLERLEPIY